MSRLRYAMTVVLMLLITGVVCDRSPATADERLWIDLDLETPTVDDFAFFIRDYVHDELYREQVPQAIDRFYVKELKSLRREGNQAVVDFVGLDTKMNKEFTDRLRFERGEDGVWYYPDAQGKKLRVQTLVNKWAHYYHAYVMPVSASGLIAACGFGAVHYIRKRKQGALVSKQPE